MRDHVFHVHAIFEALHTGRNTLSMPEDQWECSETYFYYSFQKTVLEPIGKLELIFDWELAVKRPIKTQDYTLNTVEAPPTR